MYNHYIPQSDGSYRRSTMPEGNRRPQSGRPQSPNPQQQPGQPNPPQQKTQQKPHNNPPPRDPPAQPPQEPPCPGPQPPCNSGNASILSFFRGLLPRDMDATDLLVILILLLMNQEDDRDSLSPLLTVALYFLL